MLFPLLACAVLPEVSPDCEDEPASPPVRGGGLEVLADGETAVAIDVEAGRLVFVDTGSGRLDGAVRLGARAEPFRIALGPTGELFVTLTGAGELATVDPVRQRVVRRQAVCETPRGVAVDGDGVVLVACASGELLRVDEGGVVDSEFVAPDLRDVVVDEDGRIWLSTFRSAEIVGLGFGRFRLADRDVTGGNGAVATYLPGVAWRMRSRRGGGVEVLHRLATTASIVRGAAAPYYGAEAPCTSPVLHALSTVTVDGTRQGPIYDARLAVDFVRDDGTVHLADEGAAVGLAEAGDCSALDAGSAGTGVASDAEGRSLTLVRSPFAVLVDGVAAEERLDLDLDEGDLEELAPDWCGEPSSAQAVRAFHTSPGGSAPACASCHPEGGDDGHTWTIGAETVRTQSLRGGLSETAPFHWDAEFESLEALLSALEPTRAGDADALLAWLDELPEPRGLQTADAERVAAGEKVFAARGCDGCHRVGRSPVSGSFDVGTGGAFQVPRLDGVSLRLPALHDGCATTLWDRFDPACGGTSHGDDEDLDADEIEALVTFLSSL